MRRPCRSSFVAARSWAIEHIGSSHDDVELELLIEAAPDGGQAAEFFAFDAPSI